LLDQHPAPALDGPKPRVLIAPHAGYPYSGLVAAKAFREVQGRTYDGVVVVGFTHQLHFSGSSVDDRSAVETPLGSIPIDLTAVEFLATQPTVTHLEAAHDSAEHSGEVMLPFVQVAMPGVPVVPVLMGSQDRADAEGLARALAALAARGDYLFVFSTDLSHYHPYERAVELDNGTVSAILSETAQAVDRLFAAGHLEACGRSTITAALFLSAELGYLEPRLLLYANSGDTAGDKSRVVGYAAVAMRERPVPAGAVSAEAGQALVAAARMAIVGQFVPLNYRAIPLNRHPELARATGIFVTLTDKASGHLRGCIGRIVNDESLAASVGPVALDAALRDPRFPPMTARELDAVSVEVSVLSEPTEAAGPRDIVPGRDGVVLAHDGRTGVFLPQVWLSTGWTRVEFLSELASQKAGLPPDAWKTATLLTFPTKSSTRMRGIRGTSYLIPSGYLRTVRELSMVSLYFLQEANRERPVRCAATQS
jgi:AmmeMemoRadiSam system protein B/AmmeMemoRadiSam system protein A